MIGLQLEQLPESKQQEVLDFVEFLVQRQSGFGANLDEPFKTLFNAAGTLDGKLSEAYDTLMADLEKKSKSFFND